MNKEEYIEKAEEELVHTYNRYPLVLDRGEGVYLYDTDGNKYLDFASPYVCSIAGAHFVLMHISPVAGQMP